MQLSWFRPPSDDDPGTINLCYQALDLQIIRGHANDPAVRREGEIVDYAGLLERVAALGGALKGVGVAEGDRVGVLLDDPFDELLTVLAAIRIGAVPVALPEADAPAMIDVHTPSAVVTSRTLRYATHTPSAVFLRGVEPEDPRRDLDWEIAIRAGRSEPAGTEPVSGDAVVHVAAREVTVAEIPDDSSALARQLDTLSAGGCLDLAAASGV